MAIRTTLDNIKEVCEQAFKDNDLDFSKFSQDIICFNETGVRCCVVFDNMELEKTFAIVCLGITLEREWKFMLFHARDNGYDVAVKILVNIVYHASQSGRFATSGGARNQK